MFELQGQDDPHGTRRQTAIQKLAQVRACLDAADDNNRLASETLEDIATIIGREATASYTARSWR